MFCFYDVAFKDPVTLSVPLHSGLEGTSPVPAAIRAGCRAVPMCFCFGYRDAASESTHDDVLQFGEVRAKRFTNVMLRGLKQ